MLVCEDSRRSGEKRYNWYQTLNPIESVADEDIGPSKGGVFVPLSQQKRAR